MAGRVCWTRRLSPAFFAQQLDCEDICPYPNMFQHALSDSYGTLLAYGFATATVYFLLCRLYTDHQIKKLGGVRATVLATNPLTAIPFFVWAGWKQMNDKLLDFYDGVFEWARPESPNIVEMAYDGQKRFLITREPEHVKTVLTTKFGAFGKGLNFHRVWSPFLGDSIFTTDGKLWSDSRALIRPMFIKDRVRDLDIFQRWTDALVEKMPGSGETVEMMHLFYRMTLDVTTDFLLGHSVNSLNNANDEFVQAFQEVQRLQMLMTILVPFERVFPTRRYLRGIRVLENFMEVYIHKTLGLTADELEKLSKSDKDFTFLHSIALCTRDPKVIRDQLMAVLIAGRDTTAATLSWLVYELANSPAVYAKLRSEVLATLGPTRTPTYEHLKNMTYLTHALNETLRLYPAVPYNVRAALEDTSLPGQPGQPDIVVRSHDIVVYSPLSMQRRRDLYPPASDRFADPAVFSPDRWDHWTPKAWNFVPFNGGPRICVGQNFAMTEMAFTVVRLLQKYDRLEYRGDWKAQFHRAEIVGCPGHGVPVAFFEAAASGPCDLKD